MFPLTGAIAGQARSIWTKYVTIAEERDGRMIKKWETNMNNLLIFVGSLYRKRFP